MKKYKNLLFIFFVLALFIFSACSRQVKTDVMEKEDRATSEINKEADSLLMEINETEQIDEELRSPDLDLEVNF